jgi:hypothetical protein
MNKLYFLVLVSGRPGPFLKRLVRDGLKKSQTLIVFVRVGRIFKKKSEPGQIKTEWDRFGR